MQPWNIRFALFILDSRSFEEMKPPLDEMFGGSFVQDKEHKLLGSLRYTNYLLGLDLSFSLEESWPSEGFVYRFTGGNHGCSQFPTEERMDISFHVRKLLEGVGPKRVMTLEEFRDESHRRGIR